MPGVSDHAALPSCRCQQPHVQSFSVVASQYWVGMRPRGPCYVSGPRPSLKPLMLSFPKMAIHSAKGKMGNIMRILIQTCQQVAGEP